MRYPINPKVHTKFTVAISTPVCLKKDNVMA